MTVTKIVAMIVGTVAMVVLYWWLFYWGWNWLAPVFGLPELTFWQGAGVLLMINLLFAGLRSAVKSS